MKTLDASARPIYHAVLAAMQDAENIGGPEGQDYVDLMHAIAATAADRVRVATQNRTTIDSTVGAFGLPYTKVGGVAQSLLDALGDRGYSRETLLDAITHWDEQGFWDGIGGPALDTLEESLGLQPEELEHAIGCDPEGNCECEP